MNIGRRPQPDRGDRELELGFGSVVSSRAERRLLNRDGTFNVQRKGLGFWESVSVYHALLEMTWPKFLLLSGIAYLGLNMLFAVAYALAMTLIGFVLATVIFLIAFARLGGYRRMLELSLIALASTFVLLYVFVQVVYISLPLGQGPFVDLNVALYRLLGIF